MRDMIRIYENGQVYEIDSDQIFIPWFVAGRRSGKTNMAMEALRQAKESGMTTLVTGENKNDTESKEEIAED